MLFRSNVVADTLSRTEAQDNATLVPEDPLDEAPAFLCYTIQPGIDYHELAADQQQDPNVQSYRTAISNLKLADVPFANGSFSVLCDTSTGSARPIVPEKWRQQIFDTIHSLSHPGAKTTKKLITSKFVWQGLNKQVTHWAKTCLN